MKKAENNWTRTTILLPEDQAKKLDKYCDKKGITRSVAIRFIITEWLEGKK